MAVSMIWLHDLLEYIDMATLITRYGCVNDMATLITRYGCVNDLATRFNRV